MSLLFALGLYGQTTGSISGKVTAPDGRAIPTASVTVTSATGATQTAVTGQDGTFTISNLQPGPYRVDVQVNGYSPLTQNDVQVSTGGPITVALALQPGNSTQKIQVQGQSSSIQDDNATIARAYSSGSVTDPPIIDLNHQQLVEKMPGVQPPVTFSAQTESENAMMTPPLTNPTLLDPQNNRVWATNGQSPLRNNQLLDGAEILEPVNGIAVHVPTQMSLQEMKVTTSNYQAENGRATGTVLTDITRTGNDGFHGQLFEFNSNDWLRARDYFDPAGLPQSRFTSNQFGGLLNGRIVKDKTFFLLSYQGDRFSGESPMFTTVPTVAFQGGNFAGLPAGSIINPTTGLPFANNQIPGTMLNSISQNLIDALPLPSFSGQEFNYFANTPYKNIGNRLDARIDQHFSDKTSMSLRYGLSYYETYQGALFPGISADGGRSRLRSHEGLFNVDHVFGAGLYTNLQLGMNRYSDPISALPSDYSGSFFGFSGANGAVPLIQVSGLPALGSNPNLPQINKENNYTLKNQWSARYGRNALRFGVDLWNIRFDGFQNLPYGPAGGYSFTSGATAPLGSTSVALYPNALASFLLGAPTTSGIISSSYLPSYVSWQYGGYLDDQVKFGRLTMDLGLRYDYFRPVQPRSNAASYDVFDPASGGLVPLGSGVNRFGGQHSQTLNFAPRIGMAFRVNDHTVVRAGYGMSYWNPLQYEASALIPAFTGAGFGAAGTYTVAPGGYGAFAPISSASTLAPNVPLYYTQNNFRTPYVEFYNFTVQHDLSHGILFDIGYVGNVGRDMPYTLNTNAALPGTGVTGLPYFLSGRTAPTYLRGTGFSSNYNSLQTNITKRFSGGLGFSLAYTYSKALDYGQGLQPFLNNVNPTANYGPADWDRTHVITITHDWRLPFGAGTNHLSSGVLGHVLGPWQLDGIFTWNSGLPYTPIGSTALCGCPGNTVTASLVNGGNSPYA
ncbi:MAG TPA: carboxypeptidase regulatory-like domain-containing protein, partial [Bryobacteraceae bacterium]|nr:carboxypeptidase regulatory-like domain-containing protein [Bryobacteraceae bacterium]